MKCCILLADGFETTEALTCYDILCRSKAIEPKLVSITPSLEVTSSHGVKVEAQASIQNIKLEDFDFFVLPGGKRGVDNLGKSEEVAHLLLSAFAAKKDVHAICAAPSILGNLGYLDGKRYTCFPGFQKGNGVYTGEGVTIDGNLITGKSMGYTIPFAEAIVEKYAGLDIVNAIRTGTLGL